jgi:UDPglucose 6-dehydrogenase
MKITVVGTGYVGLVTGTCLAETGNSVTCVDINEEKIRKLSSGHITIYEPGLEALFERNLKRGRLKFTTSLKDGVKGSQVIFLALPTPSGTNGEADLHYVLDAAKELGPLLEAYTVIVDKSTVPVGTAEKVTAIIKSSCKSDFDVVSNPEFLREGVAIEDFMKPDRVVIGTCSKKAANVMKTLYEPFVRQGNPILFMDERSAELTKYAANSFLATKISFMNEIANVCERLGADVDAVRRGIGTDSRIGKRFLFPGIGFGGSCFPKDVRALAKSSEEAEYDFEILQSVMSVNEKQRTKLIQNIKRHFNDNLSGKTVAVWGLSFKPETDDIREAPALYNIESLISEGCRINAHDPEAINHVKVLYDHKVDYFEDKYEALNGADALLIATEWSEFRTPDFHEMEKRMNQKLIFDGRNLYDLDSMKDLGFTYYSIGRRLVNGNGHA